MSIGFEEVRSNLIGLKTCYFKVGYGSKLKLGLGEKVYYDNEKLKGKFLGEWNIFSLHCSWRILKDNIIICGYDDDIEFCNDSIDKLEIGNIKNISQSSEMDLSIEFNSGLLIDYFCQSTYEPIVVILSKTRQVTLELTQQGWIKPDPKETPAKLNKIEEIICAYSEVCNKRWNSIVPQREGEQECSDCFYLRGIDGHFYFWDYGICSNHKSKYDGQLVSVKSGCKFHENLNDMINDN